MEVNNMVFDVSSSYNSNKLKHHGAYRKGSTWVNSRQKNMENQKVRSRIRD
ncbi:hypothetical protein HMPREF1870_00544 [Bacteroidales bacterium KA00344]|nr:hypothetical protein HMPREF1870_00544 [Bacteroidales bacterium KA00344]